MADAVNLCKFVVQNVGEKVLREGGQSKRTHTFAVVTILGRWDPGAVTALGEPFGLDDLVLLHVHELVRRANRSVTNFNR